MSTALFHYNNLVRELALPQQPGLEQELEAKSCKENGLVKTVLTFKTAASPTTSLEGSEKSAGLLGIAGLGSVKFYQSCLQRIQGLEEAHGFSNH